MHTDNEVSPFGHVIVLYKWFSKVKRISTKMKLMHNDFITDVENDEKNVTLMITS
jgi:hypothetical protein